MLVLQMRKQRLMKLKLFPTVSGQQVQEVRFEPRGPAGSFILYFATQTHEAAYSRAGKGLKR